MHIGGSYYNYLQTLSKQDLIKLLYETKKTSKPFPHKSYRTVALRLTYDGQNYSGIQRHDFIRSIEDELRTSLNGSGIGDDPVFCGRTDAGVSAVSMVVSLLVKSRFENPNRSFDTDARDFDEYPYDKIINERLPDDIMVTGWAPTPDGFNARHWCIQRYYKYYFSLKNMDLARIHEAADKIKKLTNFYKLSTHSNALAVYDRKIDELFIKKVDECEEYSNDFLSNKMNCLVLKDTCTDENKNFEEYSGTNIPDSSGYNDLYCLNIKAGSFLHNMVRKIAWLIQSYGSGKPFVLEQIRIAPAQPLVFVSAKYRNKLNFIGNRFTLPVIEKCCETTRIAHVIEKLKLCMFDQ